MQGITNNSLVGNRKRSQAIGTEFAEILSNRDMGEATPLINSKNQNDDPNGLADNSFFHSTQNAVDIRKNRNLTIDNWFKIDTELRLINRHSTNILAAQLKRNHCRNIPSSIWGSKSANSLKYDYIFKHISTAFVKISISLIALYNDLNIFDANKFDIQKAKVKQNIEILNQLSALQDFYFWKFEEPKVWLLKSQYLPPKKFLESLHNLLNQIFPEEELSDANKITFEELEKLYLHTISKSEFELFDSKLKKYNLLNIINDLISELEHNLSVPDEGSHRPTYSHLISPPTKEILNDCQKFCIESLDTLAQIRKQIPIRDEIKSAHLITGQNIINMAVMIGIVILGLHTIKAIYLDFHPNSNLNSKKTSLALNTAGNIAIFISMVFLGVFWNKGVVGNIALRSEIIKDIDGVINGLRNLFTLLENSFADSINDRCQFNNKNPATIEELPNE